MDEQTLFNQAVDITDAATRAAFLDKACAGHPELRQRVEKLLDAHLRAHSFLEAKPQPPSTVGSATADYPRSITIDSVIAGKYKIREKLGEGGMGAVYVVETKGDVKALFALKLIKPGYDSRSVLARFEQERQALALMNHPNIARFIDAGMTETGQPFFVMELIKGMPLTKFCDHEKLTVEERLQLFQPICKAVQHAHQKGIIHRDLKPSNILVAIYDGVPIPKIIDFGVAKATLQPLTDKSIYSEIGSMIGTLEYMAPEQAEVNSLDVDTRADLYSLGVILYELLTGTVPFSRAELSVAAMWKMIDMIQKEEPHKPSTKVSGSGSLPSVAATRKIEPKALTRKLQGELDWIVMKCLEKERNRRYEGPSQLDHDLENYLADLPVMAGPPSTAYRLRKFLHRHQGKVIVAALLLLSLIAGIIGTTWGLVKAVRAEGVARLEAETARATKDFVENDILQQIDPSIQANAGYLIDKDIKLRTLLDRAASKINQGSLSAEPLVLASLELTLGKAYLALGDYQQAIPWLLKSIALRSADLGNAHIETLRSRLEYSKALLKDQQYQKLELLLHEIEPSFMAQPGLSSDMLAEFKNMRVALLEHHSKYVEARVFLEEILSQRQLEYSERHLLTARAYCALAGNYLFTDDFKKAETTFLKALEIQRQQGGNGHPETLVTLLNLTSLYSKTEEPDKAEPLAEECVKEARQTYQTTHPFYMKALNNLAAVYRFRNKHQQALAITQNLYDINKAQLGADHPTTLNYQNNLAAFLIFLKDYAKAEKVLLDLVPRMEKETVFGKNHRNTLIVTRSLVQTYEMMNQLEKAEALMDKVLLATRSVTPLNQQSLYFDLVNVAGIKLKTGKYAASKAHLDEAAPLEDKEKTPVYMQAMLQRYYGELALQQKQFPEARRYLLKGAILIKSLSGNPQTKSFANDERAALKAAIQQWLSQSKLNDPEIVQLITEL